MPKQVRFSAALFTVLCFSALIFIAVVHWGISPHIPMLLGCIVAAAVAMLQGCQWDELRKGIVESITQSLESLIILLLIGVLIGIWLGSGVVPAMVYYGLKVLSPKIFLPCTMIITSLISMVVGSWGAAGTLGIAFMSLGQALGIPAPMVAGAVISGAYVGDQLSPLSDSTNLTSAVLGVNVFDHVRYLYPVVLPTYGLSVLGFLLLGIVYSGSNTAAITQNTAEFTQNLSASFTITPWLFCPVLLLVLCIFKKIPAIIGIVIGILSASVLGIVFQGGTVRDFFLYAKVGYSAATGSEMVDQALSGGGLDSMMSSISLIILAMAFGGIMERSGQMRALTRPILKRVHSLPTMTAAVVLTCLLVNAIMPDQYLAITLPGRMYVDEYGRHQIDRRKLGLALSGGGVATSSLLPWNTCGMFMTSVLGVSPLLYCRYAFFNMLLPLLVIAVAFLFKNKPSKKNNEEEQTLWN